MKKTIISAICLFVVQFIVTMPILGQITSPTLGISYGSISGKYSQDGQRISYPEMQIGMSFFTSETGKRTVNGELYWGYWNDNLSKGNDCKDCITYAYRSHNVGVRAINMWNFSFFDFGLHAGIDAQLMSRKYFGGAGIAGNIGTDAFVPSLKLKLGARIRADLGKFFRLKGDVIVGMPLSEDGYGDGAPYFLNIGLEYVLPF